jgi:hypothetical protein
MHTRYTVAIRDWRGEPRIAGEGYTNWRRTATALAVRAGLARRTDQLHDTYYEDAMGEPWGTHHVQWGRSVRGIQGQTLTPSYIVSVQPR